MPQTTPIGKSEVDPLQATTSYQEYLTESTKSKCVKGPPLSAPTLLRKLASTSQENFNGLAPSVAKLYKKAVVVKDEEDMYLSPPRRRARNWKNT